MNRYRVAVLFQDRQKFLLSSQVWREEIVTAGSESEAIKAAMERHESSPQNRKAIAAVVIGFSSPT